MIHGQSPIVITGATGWVGKTAIEFLYSILPEIEFWSRVRAFGSKFSKMRVSRFSDRHIDILPLHELLLLDEPAYTFHAAFLTRDRLAQIDKLDYIKTNQYITKILQTFLVKHPSSRVVVMSSGAASLYKNLAHAEAHVDNEPYGSLKRIEELALGKMCAASSIFRIYALSGFYIRTPHLLALGSFLQAALKNNSIEIKSQSRVWRGYVNATNLCELSFKWLFSKGSTSLGTINAVSDVIDIFALAQLVTDIFALPPLISNINPLLPAASYCASPVPFRSHLLQHQINAIPLESQIIETAQGIKMIQSR